MPHRVAAGFRAGRSRLLGGLGRCGRTLCCSTWLPMFPDITMGMAKTQDLSLNPSKVSGVCGRLLCCLSYENEQYKQMKAVMPKLGQKTETPRGPGTVVSLQLLKGWSRYCSIRITPKRRFRLGSLDLVRCQPRRFASIESRKRQLREVAVEAVAVETVTAEVIGRGRHFRSPNLPRMHRAKWRKRRRAAQSRSGQESTRSERGSEPSA